MDEEEEGGVGSDTPPPPGGGSKWLNPPLLPLPAQTNSCPGFTLSFPPGDLQVGGWGSGEGRGTGAMIYLNIFFMRRNHSPPFRLWSGVRWAITLNDLNAALPRLLALAAIGTAVSFGYYSHAPPPQAAIHTTFFTLMYT